VFWLVASGITGLVIGDALYLQALVLLGPRSTSQLLMFTPVFSVIIGLAWQHEHFTMRVLSGMCIVVGGIAYVAGHDRKKSSAYSKEPGDFSFKGLAIGLGGAICQSMGAIFARQAFLVNPGFDPFIATAIRVMASGCIIALFSIVRNDIRRIVGTFNNSGVAKRIVAGTMAGPVLGMIAYVSAFKYAPAGVVSTLSSLMPIFIIPVVAFVYKAPVNKPALVGTAVAVTGVALMTL
jgi:drug/metabolite transporter (DMT)-like permease